jgi:hypothetical protein
MTRHVSKHAAVNGVNLHYVVAGEGPLVLGMDGWRVSASSRTDEQEIQFLPARCLPQN